MHGVVFVFLALALAALPATGAPTARGGVLDLEDWDFARDGIVDLAGEWRIAWGRFEDAALPDASSAARDKIAVPGAWNGVAIDGKPAEAFGYATYRLTVNCRSRDRLALSLPLQHSAQRLYVNGRQLATQGVPGAEPGLARAAFVQQIVPIEGAACPLRIALQVSNYDMRRGGLLRSIELGTERALAERRERGLARDLVTMSGLGVVCALALLFYFWRPRERAPLWFSVYGLTAIFLAGAGGERILQPLLEPLGWDNVWKLLFLGFIGGPAAFVAFLQSLYPAAFPRAALRATLVPLGLIALLVAATPARVFTQATPLLVALAILIAAGAYVVLARAALQGRRDAWFMMIGVAALVVTGVHDTVEISSQGANKWAPWGLVVFMLVPALLLGRRFARALEAQELRSVEQEQRADLLLHATQAGVLDWDAVTRRFRYTERFAEMLGYPARADTSKWPPLFEFIHPDDRERIRDSFLEQLRDRSVRRGVRVWPNSPDFRLRKADGSYLWIHASALSLTGDDGRTLRQICTFVDISAHKALETELSERARLLGDQVALTEAIVGQAPSAIFVKSREGRFMLVNRGWTESFGFSAEETLGRTVHDLFPPEHAARFDAEDQRLISQGASAPPIETLNEGPKPGQYRIVRKAVLSKDGVVTGLVCSSTDISEIKHAEAELAAERQRLALVVSASQAGIVDWDVPAESAWFSERFKEMLGYPKEADTSAWAGAFASLIHPEDRDRSRDVFFAGLVSVGEPDSAVIQEPLELRLRRADGSWLWVQSMGLTLRDEKGEARRHLAAITDISVRRVQEEALRNQFKFVNDLVDSVPAAIAMRDTAGKYLMVNRTWEQYFGAKREDVVGHTALERAGARRGAALLALDRAVLERGPGAMQQQEDFEYRGRRYTQTRSVMADAQGKVLGVLIASIDTTERYTMVQAMERQRERLQLLVRATKSGFMDWDAQSDTRTYSERFKEMLGYPADADASQWPSLFDMMHPDDRDKTRAAFREMLRRGTESGERLHGPIEYRLRKADGSYIWVRGEGIAHLDADGRTERFITSYIDITHLRELNRALEESVRLREEVDRISRHDLKTPISSIVGIPRLLRDSGRIGREDAELLAMVEQAGYRLLGMVNLSLDMFRMEQGTYPFSPAAVDLLEVAENVVRDLRPQADSLRVAMRIEGERVHARAETLLCYSLLANLVKNALEASPGGGAVTIGLDARDDMALVRVHNEGAVPESVRERFFDKYSSAGKKSGTGLGTYSARLMARTQRGDIEMSTSETGGTTLTVRLYWAPAPVEKPGAAALPAPSPAAEPPKQLAVLVVDDDEYTRVVVQRFLPSGTRARTATNGREALEAVIADPPDAVVMDLDMPVLGGIDAAARMREWERESGRPRGALIAMSSHDDAATKTRCMEAGFDAYLEKPVSPEALRRALAEFARAPLAADPVRVDGDLQSALPGFLESRRALAGELAAALEAGDAEKARSIAHKLAGSLALYGFRWAAGQGKMIERRAKARALEGLADEVAALRRHLEDVKVEVRS